MTEEEARARIESMTLKEHEELVRACEQAWKGTPWQWRAELMRSRFNEAKRELN